MNINLSCPCGKEAPYEQCCQRFHKGAPPKTALDLMRSRYAAYVLNIPDYIIKTTHPASPEYCENIQEWTKKISDFSMNTRFERLEILNAQESGSLATVTFIAHLSQKTQDKTFTEKSYFEQIKGRWFYRSGQLIEGAVPNMITTSQMRLLPLAYCGHPILRKVAANIPEITDDIKKLVEEMIETMDACDGIGLAAPQVHYSIRLFVIRVPIIKENEKLEWGTVKVFINPVLSEPAEDTWSTSEGCLSVPTIHSDVARPKSITVEYTNLSGERIKERVSGWEARVIMHENDHLNGVLFIDRVDRKHRKDLDPYIQRLNHRIHDGTEL